MTNKYEYDISGKDFRLIEGSLATTLGLIAQSVCGKKMMHRGLLYFDEKNKIVFFGSNNIADIVTAVEQQKWHHNQNAIKVENGWTGYIIPTGTAVKRAKNKNISPVAAHFKITGKAQKIYSTEYKWPSENVLDSQPIL